MPKHPAYAHNITCPPFDLGHTVFASIRAEKFDALHRLAEIQVKMADDTEAMSSPVQAVEVFNAALKTEPGITLIFTRKAETLNALADLQSKMSLHEASQASLRESIAACDEALRHSPADAAVLKIKGSASARIKFTDPLAP